MGIGLFLLIPESKEKFEDWAKKNVSNHQWQEMPYSYFIAFFAYGFMLLIEKIAFSSQSLIPMLNGAEAHGHVHLNEEEIHSHHSSQENTDEEEEAIKNVVSTKGKFASFLQIKNCK